MKHFSSLVKISNVSNLFKTVDSFFLNLSLINECITLSEFQRFAQGQQRSGVEPPAAAPPDA